MAFNTKVYTEQGGDRQVVASGGSVDIESGGEIDVESGASLKLAGTAVSATAAEINQAADPASRYESLVTTEAMVVTDNGKTFLLNLAGGFTVTLPTVAVAGAGFWCKFIVGTAPTTAYIITEDGGSDTNVCIGGINELEVDTASDGPYSAAFTFVNLVASVAVVVDWVEYFCDGTSWYITGQTNADGGITLT